MKKLVIAVWVASPIVAFACGSTAPPQPPLEGSSVDAGEDATAPIVCGPNTTLTGNECVAVPPTPGPTCGAGTQEIGDVCVALPYDAGPPFDAGVLDGSSVTACGAGTYESDGGVCLPLSSAGSCPAGSTNLGGVCVPFDDGGSLAFAVAAPGSVQADGYTLAPVLALGPVADGGQGPAIVLAVTPPLGSLTTSQLTLGPVGATTFYQPCDSTDPTCTGSVRITLALASAPSTILATSAPIALLAPTGIGSATACLTGGNVLFFDGDPGDYIHPGTETFTTGTWSLTGGPEQVSVDMTPTTTGETTWTLVFSSAGLGTPLAPQVYTGAVRAEFPQPGHPGLDIYGDGRGCNTVGGSFQLQEIEATDAGVVQAFTATFEQHCEEADAALRGCVRYEQ